MRKRDLCRRINHYIKISGMFFPGSIAVPVCILNLYFYGAECSRRQSWPYGTVSVPNHKLRTDTYRKMDVNYELPETQTPEMKEMRKMAETIKKADSNRIVKIKGEVYEIISAKNAGAEI